MVAVTLTKNGMITLPAEIRKKFNLKPGDKIHFIDTGDQILVIPVQDLFELINPDEKEKAHGLVNELIQEHKDSAARGE